MREQRPCVIYTFHTTAAAMAMEKLCRQQDLPGRLIPTPRSITADCGIAWLIPADRRQLIDSAPGLPEFAGVYERMI
ncbi:MAG: DUF3343 domain-containing protein [Firmicutes bacterium]|nr:DUF3343 domain-containing protein [Bacillota bacterium]